jgi:predicted lipoprotein with Yx(FWY)xxD motif
MKTLMALSLGLLLSAGAAATALGADTSVTGHLRDSFCFLTMGADGASHQKCAIGCAKKGIPVLLVEDKTEKYYVLLPPKDEQSLPADVVNKMEDEVTVTGTQYSKGGMTFLTVNSVK